MRLALRLLDFWAFGGEGMRKEGFVFGLLVAAFKFCGYRVEETEGTMSVSIFGFLDQEHIS